jgi:hypothetical protein
MDSIGGAITYSISRPAGLVVTGARTLLGGGDITVGAGSAFISVTGADTSYVSAVTQNGFTYVARQGIDFFIPYTAVPADGKVQIQFTSFVPAGLGGERNYGQSYAPGQDPSYQCAPAQNSGPCVTVDVVPPTGAGVVVEGIPVGAMQSIAPPETLVGDADGTIGGSEKVVPGQGFWAINGLRSQAASTAPSTTSRGCMLWDSTLLDITGPPMALYSDSGYPRDLARAVGTPIPSTAVSAEYAATGLQDPTRMRSLNCGAAGSGSGGTGITWYSDPATVPGGIGAIDAVRVGTSFELAPKRAIAWAFPMARTTGAASLALAVDAPEPWYWQYGTTESGTVMSTYSGTGTANDGGYIQANPALVRFEGRWDATATQRGRLQRLVLNPVVIGPAITGTDTVANDTTLTVTFDSACQQVMTASISQTVRYSYTPPVMGSNGTCSATDARPGTLTLLLGDMPAPGGLPGGLYSGGLGGHETDLGPISFMVAFAAATPAPAGLTARAMISSGADSSPEEVSRAFPTDRVVYLPIQVANVEAYSGSKTAATQVDGAVATSEDFTYTLSWSNTQTQDMGKPRFVDVLPFDGDPRGTTGLGLSGLVVTSVDAEMADPSQGTVGIEYTTDPPAGVYTSVSTSGNEDGTTGIAWTAWPGAGTAPTGVTAMRFTPSGDLKSGYSGFANISVVAPALAATGRLANDIFGLTPTSSDPAQATPAPWAGAFAVVLNGRAGPKPATVGLSGRIVRDLDFSGALSAADGPWPVGAGIVEILSGTSVVATAGAGANGTFLIPVIAPGNYTVRLTNVASAGWTLVSGGSITVADKDVTGVSVLYRETLADPVLAPDQGAVQGAGSVLIDVTANDTLGLPTAPGSVFNPNTVAIASAPTYGTAALGALNAGGIAQVSYTAPAAWPPSEASKASYVDTFTYSWTNPVGISRTATVTVTVTKSIFAADDAAEIPESGWTAVDVLANDTGGQLSVVPSTVVATGDLVARAASGKVEVSSTHAFSGTDTTYSGTVTYGIVNAAGATASAAVAVTVLRKPVITDAQGFAQRISAGSNATFTPGVLDGSALTAPNPVTLAGPDAGRYAYAPAAGTLTFDGAGAQAGSYTVDATWRDRAGQTTTAPFEVTVQARPTGQGTIINLDSDTTPTTVDPLSRVTGTGLQPLTSASVTAPSHGQVQVTGGKVVYTPEPGYWGDTSFTVTACDDVRQCVNLVYTVVIRQSGTGGPTGPPRPPGPSQPGVPNWPDGPSSPGEPDRPGGAGGQGGTGATGGQGGAGGTGGAGGAGGAGRQGSAGAYGLVETGINPTGQVGVAAGVVIVGAATIAIARRRRVDWA